MIIVIENSQAHIKESVLSTTKKRVSVWTRSWCLTSYFQHFCYFSFLNGKIY